MNKRHLMIYNVLRPFVTLYLHCRFDFRSEKPKNLPEQYILLSNHATDYDPLLIASAFPDYMHFMASEHIARWGFLSKVIRYLVDPIFLSKGAPTAAVVMELLRRIRAGYNVCFFPEGLRTWDGVTNPIPPATGKLVKKAGCALITYKLTGAYFVSPMWAGAKVRRGPVRGGIVHIYSAEEVAAMTPAQLQQAISDDLYEDAYARQAKEMVKYPNRTGAVGLETLAYICPACGARDSFTTCGSEIKCHCGCTIGYDDFGTLHGCGHKTAKELYAWQKEITAQDAAQGMTYKARFGKLARLSNHSSEVAAQGEVSMDRESFRCGDFVVPLSAIVNLAMHGQRNLVFTADGAYYECKITDGNALQFFLYYRELVK